MEFMNAEDAVWTCVLSKRWKDLWKEFVSGVLCSRDGSISLLNLDIIFCYFADLDHELLAKIMEYAVSHYVQHLKIFIFVNYRFHFVFPSSIFSCPTLTSLHLSPSFWGPIWKLPKSLQLPALKVCISRISVFLQDCSLHKYAKVLWISNSNLDCVYLSLSNVDAYKIVFSTLSLSFLTVNDVHQGHQFSSTCNLSFLEVDINSCVSPCSPFLESLFDGIVHEGVREGMQCVFIYQLAPLESYIEIGDSEPSAKTSMEECHYCKAPWEEDWIQGLETRLKQMWLKKGIIHIINLVRQAIECVDVCVRFSRLPIEYYNAIGDHIGRTVRVDRNTLAQERKYVRLCVEADLTKLLLALFELKQRFYKIEYKGLHLLCLTCGRFGHYAEGCPDKGKPNSWNGEPKFRSRRN
ncbi:hypothetical protein JHK87_000954 [Glycine soja]|nr:hypothetical protein JHK87_000954 [Glycine soja]